MAHSNGTTWEYSTNGSDYTAIPCPVVGAEPPQGSTTNVNRSHLNNTNGLATTSPGNRQQGKLALTLEMNTRTDAHWDFLQLMNDWWEDRTEGLYFKCKFPKASSDTVNPNAVYIGYVDQQPHPTHPEDDRMQCTLQVQLTADITYTDGSAP
jgi:hypothetical protein